MKVPSRASISSEAWDPLITSLAVGRVQFLVVVGLRPSALRGHSLFPVFFLAFMTVWQFSSFKTTSRAFAVATSFSSPSSSFKLFI